jgi:hypothetical protein
MAGYGMGGGGSPVRANFDPERSSALKTEVKQFGEVAFEAPSVTRVRDDG